jgi:hypothetical protein
MSYPSQFRIPPPPGTYDIRQIAAKLGYARRDHRALRGFVTALIDQRGFPAPLPSLARGPELLITDGVTSHSKWLAPAVDAWLDNFLPPAAALALDAAARRAAAQDMDHAATTLRLVAGGSA